MRMNNDYWNNSKLKLRIEERIEEYCNTLDTSKAQFYKELTPQLGRSSYHKYFMEDGTMPGPIPMYALCSIFDIKPSRVDLIALFSHNYECTYASSKWDDNIHVLWNITGLAFEAKAKSLPQFCNDNKIGNNPVNRNVIGLIEDYNRLKPKPLPPPSLISLIPQPSIDTKIPFDYKMCCYAINDLLKTKLNESTAQLIFNFLESLPTPASIDANMEGQAQ